MWERQSEFQSLSGQLCGHPRGRSRSAPGPRPRRRPLRRAGLQQLLPPVSVRSAAAGSSAYSLRVGEEGRERSARPCAGQPSARLARSPGFQDSGSPYAPECRSIPTCSLVLGLIASQGIRNTVPETGDQLPQGRAADGFAGEAPPTAGGAARATVTTTAELCLLPAFASARSPCLFRCGWHSPVTAQKAEHLAWL